MVYRYCNPQNENEFEDVVQGVNDEHVYFKDGVKWDRIFFSPQAIIGNDVDPFSKRQFLEKTANPDTYGSLLDRSTELSQKRAKMNGGIDPIKVKYEKEYSKQRRGRKLVNKIGSTLNKTFDI